MDVIITINDKDHKTAYNISKAAGSSYSYIYYVLKELEKLNMVIMQKKGRRLDIKLTDKGLEVVNYLRKVNTLMELRYRKR